MACGCNPKAAKIPDGGLGGAVSPGSGAGPREPNAFQPKFNENGFKLVTIGVELGGGGLCITP